MTDGLVPRPHSVQIKNSEFPVHPDFLFQVEGPQNTTVEEALKRWKRRNAAPVVHGKKKVLVQFSASSDICAPLDRDESYSIFISESEIKIKAPESSGVLWALETLWQLLEPRGDTYYLREGEVTDRPRFQWRGLLIDCVRHPLSLKALKRNIDAMSAVKLNVLHLHLTDDQGFRIESKRFPRLTEKGSSGHYYTQDEMKDLIQYAWNRGIRIVPEFDVPGHTRSWLAAYPELACEKSGYKVATTYGVHPPAMDPTREKAFQFLKALFQEMAELFPDPFFHMGGDEAGGEIWMNSAPVKDFMNERGMTTKQQLQAHFNRKVFGILKELGKNPIGWDEVLDEDLTENVTVQVWRGVEGVNEAVQRQFPVIISFGYYLDHLLPGGFHYNLDSIPEKLSEGQKKFILGGEACMWSEYLTEANLDSRLWPRAGLIAERFWSFERSPGDIYERILRQDRRWEAEGLLHRLQVEVLLSELAPPRFEEEFKIFTSFLEPLKYLYREKFRSYTVETPMNRLVDALPPESETARVLNIEVENLLSDPEVETIKSLKSKMSGWMESLKTLNQPMTENEKTKELGPLLEKLRGTLGAGVQVLEYLERNEPVPQGWLAQAIYDLEFHRHPIAEVQVALRFDLIFRKKLTV